MPSVIEVAEGLPAGEPLRTPALMNVYRWFLPMVASVYLGTAEEAAAEAHQAQGKGINSAHRNEALTDVLVGEMTAALITARSVRDQVVAQIQEYAGDLEAALVNAVALKEIVISQAIAPWRRPSRSRAGALTSGSHRSSASRETSRRDDSTRRRPRSPFR